MTVIQLLIKTVRRIIVANPDVIYSKTKSALTESCSYTKGLCSNGTQGCVVGQAFAALGFDMAGIEGSITTLLHRDGNFGFLAATNEQREWLQTVQGNQDCGNAWAVGLIRADEQQRLKRLAERRENRIRQNNP